MPSFVELALSRRGVVVGIGALGVGAVALSGRCSFLPHREFLPTSETPSQRVVREFITALIKGDANHAFSLMHPDVTVSKFFEQITREGVQVDATIMRDCKISTVETIQKLPDDINSGKANVPGTELIMVNFETPCARNRGKFRTGLIVGTEKEGGRYYINPLDIYSLPAWW